MGPPKRPHCFLSPDNIQLLGAPFCSSDVSGVIVGERLVDGIDRGEFFHHQIHFLLAVFCVALAVFIGFRCLEACCRFCSLFLLGAELLDLRVEVLQAHGLQRLRVGIHRCCEGFALAVVNLFAVVLLCDHCDHFSSLW